MSRARSRPPAKRSALTPRMLTSPAFSPAGQCAARSCQSGGCRGHPLAAPRWLRRHPPAPDGPPRMPSSPCINNTRFAKVVQADRMQWRRQAHSSTIPDDSTPSRALGASLAPMHAHAQAGAARATGSRQGLRTASARQAACRASTSAVCGVCRGTPKSTALRPAHSISCTRRPGCSPARASPGVSARCSAAGPSAPCPARQCVRRAVCRARQRSRLLSRRRVGHQRTAGRGWCSTAAARRRAPSPRSAPQARGGPSRAGGTLCPPRTCPAPARGGPDLQVSARPRLVHPWVRLCGVRIAPGARARRATRTRPQSAAAGLQLGPRLRRPAPRPSCPAARSAWGPQQATSGNVGGCWRGGEPGAALRTHLYWFL